MISCPRTTLRVLLRETGSTPDARLAPCMWLGGCQFLLFSGYDIASEGLLEGTIEMIIGEMLWLIS